MSKNSPFVVGLRSAMCAAFAASLFTLLCATGCSGWVDIAGSPDNSGSSPHGPHSSSDDESGSEIDEKIEAGHGGMRRLSSRELNRTLEDLYGDRLDVERVSMPDPGASAFDNNFPSQSPSQKLIRNVSSMARRLAEKSAKKAEASESFRTFLIGCGRAPSGADDRECFESFLETFGPRVLRRPMSESQKTLYLEKFFELGWLEEVEDSAVREKVDSIGFYDKVEYALRAMFQSPDFLYRPERGEPVEGKESTFRLDSWALANRLSYFLWGSMPDSELRQAAIEGRLSTAEEIRTQAERMLDDPRAREAAVQFHAMWLGFSDFYRGETDGAFDDPALAEAAREETRRAVVEFLFEREAPWTELITLEKTWVTEELADHYGLPKPDDPDGGWVRYPSDSLRKGILSHASFLGLGAAKGRTKIIQRSEYILDHLACDPIPPPDDTKKDQEPQGEPPECKAESLQWKTLRGSCMGCHAKLNAPGMALENFDGVGRYREYEGDEENCKIGGIGKIRERTEDGWGLKYRFKGPKGLATALVGRMNVGQCMVKHLYEFAMGHKLTGRDEPVVERISEDFAANNYDYQELLLSIVTAEPFRYRINEAGALGSGSD